MGRIKQCIGIGCIVISLLLFMTACHGESIELIQDDLGYNISAFIDQDEDVLLNQLERMSSDLHLVEERDHDAIPWRSYSVTDTIFDESYTVTLYFGIYGDRDEYRLLSYEKVRVLSEYPEGEEQRKIQQILDAMVQSLGNPEDHNLRDLEDMFSGYDTDKTVNWNQCGDFYTTTLTVYREPLDQDTIVVKVYGRSEENVLLNE